MRSLSKRIAIFLTLSMGTVLADDPAQGLVEAEKAFAQKSMTAGIGSAFMQFLAPDSIVLKPQPENAREFYGKYDSAGRKLLWQPVVACVSRSGDLGMTSGPWEMRKAVAGSEKAVAFGQFVSIWKKQPDGSWKVALDGGTQNPQPSETPGEPVPMRPNEQSIDAAEATRALEAAERSFVETLKEGAGPAITVVASDDVRILRDNAMPAIDQAAARLMLSSDNGKMVRKELGGAVASSADLAYRYGSYSSERGNVTEHGYFLTVWRFESDRQWRVILDLQNKIADKKE